MFHHVPSVVGEVRRDAWCNPCYNAIQGYVNVEGQQFPKQQLVKKKNDDDLEEPWVQCDYCEDWYHQICVLFNGRKNEGGSAPFTCPNCILSQLDKEIAKSLSNVRLPSNQRTSFRRQRCRRFWRSTFRRLSPNAKKREAARRAAENASTAEGLTIRVVSQTMKQVDTKPQYLAAFKDDGIPAHFPYRSRVILLFQNLDAVDVCLMAIYVQEYDGDCPEPNRRRIYLSYLDSVKYFRPDNVTVATGENCALRTYVYHNILIAHLDSYAKKLLSPRVSSGRARRSKGTITFSTVTLRFRRRRRLISCANGISKCSDPPKSVASSCRHRTSTMNSDCNQNHDIRCATEYPYFDGDYFSGIAEDWITSINKELEEAKKLEVKTKARPTSRLARKSWLRA